MTVTHLLGLAVYKWMNEDRPITISGKKDSPGSLTFSAMHRSCINSQGKWPLTHISRARHYLTLKCLRNDTTITTYHQQKVIRGLLNCAIANDLEWPSKVIPLFLSENKCSRLFQSLIESTGDLILSMTFENHFRRYKCFHCLLNSLYNIYTVSQKVYPLTFSG